MRRAVPLKCLQSSTKNQKKKKTNLKHSMCSHYCTHFFNQHGYSAKDHLALPSNQSRPSHPHHFNLPKPLTFNPQRLAVTHADNFLYFCSAHKHVSEVFKRMLIS